MLIGLALSARIASRRWRQFNPFASQRDAVMGSLKMLLSAGAIAAGLSGPAFGAHKGALAPPPMLGAAPAPAELGTGWYLRGDVGYIDYSKPREAIGYSLGMPFDSITLDNTWSVGGGVGYAFNGWLRGDATVDYRANAQVRALSSGSGYVDGFSTDALKLESTTFL